MHSDEVKRSYPRIKYVYVSEFCRNEDVLDNNVLKGSDNFWKYQHHEVNRGEADNPVAVKTVLGGILSGPFQGRSIN